MNKLIFLAGAWLCLTAANCGTVDECPEGEAMNEAGVCVAPICIARPERCIDGSMGCPACADATPVCDMSDGECVECLNDSHCSGERPRCDTTTKVCVQCFEDNDCKSPTPACNLEMNSCEAECTRATQEADCSDRVCNTALGECTDSKLYQLESCQSCVASDECLIDHECVPMTFKASSVGSFCLKVRSTGCTRPFGALYSGKNIEGDDTKDYCSIDTTSFDCTAYNAFISKTSCADVTCDGNGGMCADIDGKKQCTIPCTDGEDDCPSGTLGSCGGGPPKYCGG